VIFWHIKFTGRQVWSKTVGIFASICGLALCEYRLKTYHNGVATFKDTKLPDCFSVDSTAAALQTEFHGSPLHRAYVKLPAEMTGGSGSGSGGTPSGGTANGKPPMQRMASSQSAVTISQGLSTATVPLSRTGSVSVIPETDDDGDNSKVRKSAPQFSRQPTHLGTSGLSITNETGLKIAQKLEMVSDKLDNIARAILNLPKKNDSVATAARIEAKKEENKKKKRSAGGHFCSKSPRRTRKRWRNG